MSYKGYVAEIPAGDGGVNFDENPGRVPISDLIDAEGVIVEDGLLRREPGASLFSVNPIGNAPASQSTLSTDRNWSAIGITLQGSGMAHVPAATMVSTTNCDPITSYVEFTVPAGGIAVNSLLVVSSHLYTAYIGNPICQDSKGNYYSWEWGWTELPVVNNFWTCRLGIALVAGDKITLICGTAHKGDAHVGIVTVFTGIKTAPYKDLLGRTHDNSSVVFMPYNGSMGYLPELLVAIGRCEDSSATTVTANLGFTKIAEATNGPGAGKHRAWHQYRIDTTSPTVIGLHDWRPTSTTQRIITATLAGNLFKEVGGDLDSVTLASGLSSTARPGKFTEGGQEAAGNNRKLFYFNGVDPVKRLRADDAAMSTIASPAADWTGSNQPLGGMIQRNRLCAWGNLNHPHQLYLSTVTNHEDFSTGSGVDVALNFTCYPSVGDRLYSGAKARGLLWLFKWPKGIFWLDDSDPDPSVWSMQMLTDALGCIPSPYGALGIDNDIMFMAADASFHLLSTVEGGVVEDSNLSMAMRHARWLRSHVNMSKLSQVVSLWYPHKKWAIWGLPGTDSLSNNLTLIFDFSEVHAANALPRLFISNRDTLDALALRVEADKIERPMLGEGGLVWLLDRDARNKNNEAYTFRYQTVRTDFSHIEPRLAAREKLLDHLELILTPSTGTMTLTTELDGTAAQTLTVDLTKHRQRHRLTGKCFEFSLIGTNSEANVDPKIQRHFVLFREGDEGKL